MNRRLPVKQALPLTLLLAVTLALVVACGGDGTREISPSELPESLLELLPQNADSFTFANMEQVRDERLDQLEDQLVEQTRAALQGDGYLDIEDAESLLMADLGSRDALTLLLGRFDADDVADALDDDGFRDSDHLGVAVWSHRDRGAAVALIGEDIVLSGEENRIEEAIEAFLGDDRSMAQDDEAEALLEAMEGALVYNVSDDCNYRGCDQTGTALRVDDRDLTAVFAFHFRDDDAAEDSQWDIEDDLEVKFDDIIIEVDGRMLVVVADVDEERVNLGQAGELAFTGSSREQPPRGEAILIRYGEEWAGEIRDVGGQLFQFYAEEGYEYLIRTRLGSVGGTMMQLFGPGDFYLVDGRDGPSELYLTAPESGEYYLEVVGFGSYTGTYTLTIDVVGEPESPATALAPTTVPQPTTPPGSGPAYWKWHRYVKPGVNEDFRSYVPLLSDFPQPPDSGYYDGVTADDFFLIEPHIAYENSVVGFRTWLYHEGYGEYNVGIRGDDGVALYANGVFVAGRGAARDPASYGLMELYDGWNKIEALVYNGPTYIELELTPPLGTLGVLDANAQAGSPPPAAVPAPTTSPPATAAPAATTAPAATAVPVDDHGNDRFGATPIGAFELKEGRIDWPDDRDFFYFNAERGRDYHIETHLGSIFDTVLVLYDPSGDYVTEDDDSGNGGASRLLWRATSSGTYYLEVLGYDSSDVGTYQLILGVEEAERPTPFPSITPTPYPTAAPAPTATRVRPAPTAAPAPTPTRVRPEPTVTPTVRVVTLPTATVTPTPTPRPRKPGESSLSFRSVSIRYDHGCGVLEGGSIRCWGNNEWGQATPPEGRFLSVIAAGRHSCGVLEGGSVRCWGDDEYGQAAPPEGQFLSVSATVRHVCGVLVGGSVRCWGDDRQGQATPPEGRFLSVSVGTDHSCGVLQEGGSVSCWGEDRFGQATPPEGRFLSVSAGDIHSCGLLETGSIRCWGDDRVGQSTPPEGRFLSIGAGAYHVCGVLEGGSVRCWGNNRDGQATPPEGRFLSVNAGFGTSCGLLESGYVRCWGDNEYGQATPP